MNPLQQLIRDRMAERGWSYADVARRGGIPRSTVHHLATADNLRRPPHRATLEGLAEGLTVPVGVVRAAAASAAGLAAWQESTPDPELKLLVAALTRLDATDRRHVLALVQSLLSVDRSN
ncbi:helix-turn-helix domain-containing protein [Krasilnikovia sp. M28-CT-15]|uniref:helix-turn-helix domain-containing protein n=1 Tax=Krasilnikovia sp. M28-CT-15 TaxID=3373540 RepID=UPI003876A50E